MRDKAEAYRRYLEGLTEARLAELPDYVSAEVRFADPFNDVHGAHRMAEVFRHLFAHVRDIRFEVRHLAMDGATCLMAWRFCGCLNSGPWQFDGASVVRFDGAGLVCEHIDYWDAAGALYERLPLIGRLLAAVRRRLSAHGRNPPRAGGRRW